MVPNLRHVSSTSAESARERLRPFVERARAFSGWMPDARTRRLGQETPWDYVQRARQLLSSAGSVLDLGTGGGERLSDILRGFRGRAVATEEWVVNAPLAARQLRPLGAGVLWCSALSLPLAGESFELVLDRHEALEPAEVARVLAPGGMVLTQQVWDYANELTRFFPADPTSATTSTSTSRVSAPPASKSSTHGRTPGGTLTRVWATSFTRSASRPGKSPTSIPWEPTWKRCSTSSESCRRPTVSLCPAAATSSRLESRPEACAGAGRPG